MTKNLEDYIHRVGRTARGGSFGTSITLFTADNIKLARDLVGVLREAGQAVEPALEAMVMRGNSVRGRGGRGGYGRGYSRGGYGGGARPFLTGSNAGWNGPQH
jgi:ATP-dependent RNA helicase DDX5/DBP2